MFDEGDDGVGDFCGIAGLFSVDFIEPVEGALSLFVVGFDFVFGELERRGVGESGAEEAGFDEGDFDIEWGDAGGETFGDCFDGVF